MRPILSAALGGLLAWIAISSASAAGVSLRDSVPHIAMTGHAEVDVVPDEAFVRIGVMIERPSAVDASGETARIASALRDEILAQGVDAKDVRTASASLITVYDEQGDPVSHTLKRTLRGYQSDVEFEVHVRDVKKAGSLAQALIGKGANRFSGIRFHYTKEKETRLSLQGEAMQDAVAEAQSYTRAIGLRLGRVIQIGGDAGRPEGQFDLPVRAAMAAAPVSATAIPFEPGVQTISSDIAVVWELETGP